MKFPFCNPAAVLFQPAGEVAARPAILLRDAADRDPRPDPGGRLGDRAHRALSALSTQVSAHY